MRFWLTPQVLILQKDVYAWFQPFLRFWEVPYKLAVLDEGGVVSTLLEILDGILTPPSTSVMQVSVSTLLEILAKFLNQLSNVAFEVMRFNPS